jgi:hypothetical protein
MKLLIAFCVGIAATLAWQSYGDAARGMIANSYPQFGWLAPLSAVAQTAPAAMVPPATSSDPEDLETISLSLGAMRQRVDDLVASQDQITRDITTKLQVAKQEILDRISSSPPQPAAAPPRNSAPPRPQVAPVR